MEEEVKILPGKMEVFSLREGNSIILNFEHKKNSKKNEIQFISFSHKFTPFKMFVSKSANPSSQNTLTVIPSWMGGYYTSIDKESPYWCEEDCTYYILLEAEKGASDISFMVRYEDTVQKMKHIHPIFSTLKPLKMHCYSIDIKERFKKENLIIETILFSGSATLGMNPWKNPVVYPNEINRNEFKINEDINTENIRIVTPEERKSGNQGKYFIFYLF